MHAKLKQPRHGLLRRRAELALLGLSCNLNGENDGVGWDGQRAGHRAFARRVARGKDLEGEGMGVFSGSGAFLTEAEGALHA